MSDLLTKNLKEEIKQSLAEGEMEQARALLGELYPEDIAELFFSLSVDEMQEVLDLLEKDEAVMSEKAA